MDPLLLTRKGTAVDASPLQAKATRRSARTFVSMIAEAGSGHPGGIALLRRHPHGPVLRRRHGATIPANPHKPGRDRFVLAKGHAAPALYATLAHAGYFPPRSCTTLRKLGTRLQGHPDCQPAARRRGVHRLARPGAFHGRAALRPASRLTGERRPPSSRCSVTASARRARCGRRPCSPPIRGLGQPRGHRRQQRACRSTAASTRCAIRADLGEKFAAFGWDVAARADGHDIAALVEALRRGINGRGGRYGRPVCVIARTVKGKGVSFMEDQAGWHGKAPNAEELETRLWPSCDAAEPRNRRPVMVESWQTTMRRSCTRTKATRAAYGATLGRARRPRACPSWPSTPTSTGSTTTKKLADAGYAERLFNCGIAEQNMIDVAAGPVATPATSPSRAPSPCSAPAAPTTRSATPCATANLNVKIAPTHAGISVGPDGGSHQMLEDIALMRGLPGMRVLVPADYAAARAAIRLAAATPGPVYVRMGRAVGALRLRRRGGAGRSGRAYVLREGTRRHHRGLRRGDPRGPRRRRRAGGRGHLGRGHRRVLA